jgi:hypothetical protein
MPVYLFSVSQAGKTYFLPMEHGHNCIKIASYYPIFFARTEVTDREEWCLSVDPAALKPLNIGHNAKPSLGGVVGSLRLPALP